MRTDALPLCLVLLLAATGGAFAQTDGPLDTTFATGGWDFWNPSFATGVKVDDLAVRPDGKLAITGRVFAVGDRDALSCARAGNGGSGTCVNLTYDLGGGNNNDGAGIAAQSGNQMVIVGEAQGPAADPAWVATVHRMTAANALDGTFNGGTGPFDLSSTYDVDARAVTVADDKIYLAGTVSVDVGSDFFVAVREADGTPETAWSGDGWATAAFDLGGNDGDFAEAIAVDPLGRVVAGGLASDGTDFFFAVARFTAAGVLDGGWSGDGEFKNAAGAGSAGPATAGAAKLFLRTLGGHVSHQNADVRRLFARRARSRLEGKRQLLGGVGNRGLAQVSASAVRSNPRGLRAACFFWAAAWPLRPGGQW